MRRVWIERREECLGEQACVVVCGEVFGIGEDGRVTIRGGWEGEVGEELESCIEEARKVCPVDIIRWQRV
ncbi:MAG: ferredoxin [Acidilobaceae archaeon]|nr:ferredoxin [Acidilobaceae archaeon]MCX8165779.1 ferredoxin [Acidilobaceae archaeon]MDW7974204.1 ferredoxin [Sulfolobales archaeon]